MAWINKVQPQPSSNTKSAGGGGFGSMKTNQDMEEELKTQHASGHVSPELEQLLLRMRVDKLMTERTTDAQTTFMNTMEEILKELGIELGFKQIMTIEPERGMKKVNNSFLEIARQDHAAIYKRMNQ